VAPEVARSVTLAECIPILLRHKLISPSSLVRGQVVVEDKSSRNSNRRVSRQRGAHYLLKQSTETGQDATVRREAQVYRRLSRMPQFAPNLVRFFCYDSADGVLILEYVRGMSDLTGHFMNGGRLTTTISRTVARVLGLLHHIDTGQLGDDLPLAAEPPWIFSLHRPSLRSLRDISSGNLELIRAVQAIPEVCDALDEMRAVWQPSAFIHMDIRWSNWLIADPGAAKGLSRIKLLDWETACLGDPRWDVGCALADNLIWWALQAPEAGGEISRRSASKNAARRMHEAMRAFWCEYREAMPVDSAEQEAFLHTSLRHAGARLVQTAYERLQRAANIDRFSVTLLQMSANILRYPQAAADTLCGLTGAG